MTDSDSDTSNNVFNFQNDNTTVINAKGPNTNFSFRNPMTSRNYERVERQRYAESAYDQRSMSYRRETSPMSTQSACDIRPRNFQQYPGMSSRQSLWQWQNGRSGSPMSMRSIDSSASVSAADIAFALKNVKFNKNDLKVIMNAYQKLLKSRVKKRIEKRRNMRLLLKGRRRSSDDSGDQASDSSVSSDDYRSVKTYKENMSSSRSARMDLTDFRKTFKDRNMLKDSSDNFSQNTLKNKFSVLSSSVNNNTQNFNNTVISNQSNSMPTQRDRFRNGFLLPSQRFNRSVASSVILENPEKPQKFTGNNLLNNVKNYYAQNNRNKNNCPSGSEEEIFSEMTAREKRTFNIDSQRKRNLDSEDESSLPVSKRSRITSPAKSAPSNKKAPLNLKNNNPANNNVELSNGFEFAKPSLPVRKSKHRVQEKLIAKSSQPLTDYVEPMPKKIQENIKILQLSNLQEKSNDNLTQLDQSETTQNSDVSSRPSFIKRKLFTQNLDVAEKANLSTDATNSPQSSVYSLQKEKNKSRKLVTNQSCLSREVEDDNNLLDLIHKIVPPDRMNLTNQTTINQSKNYVNNKNDNEAKWDVSSVISICNVDDGSDTYTDEEIFKADNTKLTTNKNKDINSKANPIDKVVTKTLIPQGCHVMLKQLEINKQTLQKQVVNQNFNLTHNNDTKNYAKSLVKTFWDTDCESDVDCQTVLPRSHVTDILKKANATLDTTKQDFKNPIGYARSEISQKNPDVQNHLNNSLMNNTVTNFNSMFKMNTSTLSVRSHRTSKKKKCCNETCANETKSKLDNTGHKKKDNSEEPVANNLGMINAKTKMIQSKNSTDMPKSKLNNQNEKSTTVVRSTSQSKKSPKEKKSIKDKQVSPKNKNKKSESKSKLEKSSSVNIKKSNTEAQHNKTAIKNKAEKQNENTKKDHKSKIQSDKQQSKKLKTPKTKPKSKSEHTPSNKNNPVSQPMNLNLNNTVEPIQNTSFVSGRAIRSCRKSNQSRSIELSGSAQLNNTSDNNNRSLRSRVINLSSSIENITIKIKPKNNKNNKNISQINTRKSDISFSLGSKQQTPVPKKTSARSRVDFCKGRRKP